MTLVERLREISTKDCQIFEGRIVDTGYGRVYRKGKPRYKLAHRVAWEKVYGPIPDGLQIDHLCRNRACINVGHLELVTSKENTLRGISITAENAKKTHCCHGHELSGDNLYIDPAGHRGCRTCRRFARRRCDRAKAAKKKLSAALAAKEPAKDQKHD